VCFLTLALVTPGLYAQSTFAVITGVVTDQFANLFNIENTRFLT